MLFQTPYVHTAGGTTEQCRYYAEKRKNYLLLTLCKVYFINAYVLDFCTNRFSNYLINYI